jgi:hypothetical protein
MININDKTQCFKLEKLFEELNANARQDLRADGGFADIGYNETTKTMYVPLENTFDLKDILTLVLAINDENPGEVFYLTHNSETGEEISYDYEGLIGEAERQKREDKITCAKYDCDSKENLKLCFQCDTLFCDNCAPAGTDFDDNTDPEEIYCSDCVPNECDKCGDKSYKYSTERCPKLGDGYYCSECIEEEEEEEEKEDLCDECGDDERIGQCVNLDCNKLFCAKHGRAWTEEDAPDNIFCSEKCIKF